MTKHLQEVCKTYGFETVNTPDVDSIESNTEPKNFKDQNYVRLNSKRNSKRKDRRTNFLRGNRVLDFYRYISIDIFLC